MEGAGHGFGNHELDRRLHAFLDHHLLGQNTTIPSTPIPVR